MLSMLLEHVGHHERVLIVEDSDELRPAHPHAVKLLSRPPNIEGTGEVTLRSLVRQAMRMRPDRIVVGEVRGAEVVELLMALNTGHRGGAGTIHANSVRDVPARVLALGSLAEISAEAIRTQLAAAIDVLIHVVRRRDGVRSVDQIAVLQRQGAGIDVCPVWTSQGGFTGAVAQLDHMVQPC